MKIWSFFALGLTTNYRDIILREFLESFALLLTPSYRDIMLPEFPEFLNDGAKRNRLL